MININVQIEPLLVQKETDIINRSMYVLVEISIEINVKINTLYLYN